MVKISRDNFIFVVGCILVDLWIKIFLIIVGDFLLFLVVKSLGIVILYCVK